MAERPWGDRDLKLFFTLAQTGIEMVLPIGVGVLIDRWTGWTPWATLAGAVIGPVLAIWHMVVLTNRYQQTPPP